MKRELFFLSTLCAGCLVPVLSGAQKPNVIVILADDLGYGDLQCYGAKNVKTPNVDRVPCVFIENGKVADYDPSAPIYVNYEKNFEGEPTGNSNPELLYNLQPSHGHDMSIVNGISRIGYMKGGGKAFWKDENIADSITVHAIDFIKSHKDTPFFMYFATNDVHVPRFPHERFRGQSGMGLRGDAIVHYDHACRT